MHRGGAVPSRFAFTLVVLLSLVLPSCFFGDGGPGEVRQRELTVPNNGAQSVRYVITQHVGALSIAGGADGLLDADLTYNERLNPTLDHDPEDDQQTITLTQPSIDGKDGEAWEWLPYRVTDNHWRVQLSSEAPADIELRSDQTRLETDLSTVPVRSLLVFGDGRMVTIGLDGEQPNLSTVRIESNVGAAWLNMEGSYRKIDDIDVTTRSGDITLVMLGEWAEDVQAAVATGSGNVTLHVPEDIGVEIEATAANGEINQIGFRRQGELWVNDAWGTTEVTLRLSVESESGDIAFRTEPRDQGE